MYSAIQDPMKRERKDVQVNYRCTAKEARRLRRVAAHYDLSLAAVIRMLVKKEALAIKRAAGR